MLKIFLKIIVFLFPLLVVFFYTLFFLPTTLDADNMLSVSIDKRNRLKSIEKPKIVFIGGSSIAFGLDSKTVEEKLNYPVVNMGIHAGIGLRYMLLETESYLKKGDIVVIAAEYEQFTQLFYGEETLVPLLFEINNDYQKLDLISTIYLFPDIASYNLTRIRNLLSYKKPNKEIDTSPKKPELYAKSSFNEYGDMVAHWTMDTPKQNISINEKIRISNNVITFLKDFKQKMEMKGVKVLFAPPPYKEELFNQKKEEITNIDKRLKKEGLNYIALPSRYTFSDSLFFDTIYHLNKKGVDKRTQYIIEDLSRVIN